MSSSADIAQAQAISGFVSSLHQRLHRQFKVQVADWQDICRELPAWEDHYLLISPLPERLAEHTAILDRLERVGRRLLVANSQVEF